MPSLWSVGESHPPRPTSKPSLFFRRRAVLLTPERWLLQVQPASALLQGGSVRTFLAPSAWESVSARPLFSRLLTLNTSRKGGSGTAFGGAPWGNHIWARAHIV